MKIKIFTLCALMCAAVAWGDTVTVSTNPVGAYTISCPANADTYVSVPVTRAAEFIGAVESVQAATTKIVAKGEPNWTANKFVYVSGTQSNHYYLKFTSGELNGAWYDITSNDAYSLTIDIGETELAKVAMSDTFQIIPHWTLSTLLPEGGGLNKSDVKMKKAGASIVKRYTSYEKNGGLPVEGSNKGAQKMFYYREYETDIGWRDYIDSSDASDIVIEPNSCFVVKQPSNKEGSTISLTGNVPMCATSFELYRLSDEELQDNFVAIPTCTQLKLSDLTDALVSSGVFVPSTGRLVAAVDAIFVYDNKEVKWNPNSSQMYFYRKYGETSNWLNRSKEIADNDILKAGTVIVIKKKATGSITSERVSFKPNYVTE